MIAPIDVDRAPAAMVRVLAPIVFHNRPSIFRVRITCTQTSARRMRCAMRGYNARGHRVLLERIRVRSVRAHRELVFEDYSGWVRYVPAGRATPSTLYLDPSS